MRRLSVPAQLAAVAQADAAEIDALPRGGVWARLLVDANDATGNDECPNGVRLYVERLVIGGSQIFWRLEHQDGDWDWTGFELLDGEVQGEVASGAEVVENYPLLGGLAERRIARLHAGLTVDAKTAEENRDEDDARLRVCARCAFDSGARWAYAASGFQGGAIVGACVVCGCRSRWIHLLDDWKGLSPTLVDTIRARTDEKIARIAETSKVAA